MKIYFIVFFLCLFFSCNNSKTETVEIDPEKKTVIIEEEISPSPEEKALQDAVKDLKISSAYCYERKLREEDSFKLYEIRNYDENGRLSSSYLVDSLNTYRSVTKTFVYNSKGVLKQINIKTPNQGEINEFFIYNKKGQLTTSYEMVNIGTPYTDTFQFRRSGDTLFKYKIEGKQVKPDSPHEKIFNKKGQIIKEIERYPTITPTKVVTKTYEKDFPLPVKEIYSKSLLYPMEYKIEYKFKSV